MVIKEEFKGVNLNDYVMNFIVLSNGKIVKLKIDGTLDGNEQFHAEVKRILENLPAEWFPALAFSKDIGDFMGPFDEREMKGKVNSEVVLRF
jgi:hypothetical protein